MPLGSASVTKNNIQRDVKARVSAIRGAYQKGESAARESLDANTPVLSGDLKESNKVTPNESGIGFTMSSYGSNRTGRAYAKHVNDGHFVRKADGSTTFVPPNPYFSRAQADAEAAIRDELRR